MFPVSSYIDNKCYTEPTSSSPLNQWISGGGMPLAEQWRFAVSPLPTTTFFSYMSIWGRSGINTDHQMAINSHQTLTLISTTG